MSELDTSTPARPSETPVGVRPSVTAPAAITRRIVAIALNTFREAVRNRVLAILFLFALAMMSFSIVLGELSIHEEIRIIKDLGLAGISLFGLAIALFLGVNLLAKELEKKTVYAILPKPIRRWEFLLGKYLGLVATITVVVVVMSLFVAAMLLVEGASVDAVLVRAQVLVWFELLLVVAVAMVFSSFSSPYLSAMFTAACWVIGRNTGELEAFATTRLKGQPTGMLIEGVVRVVPDFRMFFVSGASLGGDGVASIHERFVTWGYVASAGGYALLYVVTCLIAASLIFARRDFT
jgi:Cu-processing system permease protein